MQAGSEETIGVAMSGGVDSTAALLRLLEGGAGNIFGMTALLHSASGAGAERAARVCSELGVAHYTVDLTETFHSRVVGTFAAEYREGRTPNPCITCNKHVKFGILWEKARSRGVDEFATGHYARTRDRDGIQLLRAADLGKDQSYVLYRLSQQQLEGVRFANGEFTRQENEQLVANSDIDVEPADESRGVCFLGGASHHKWLAERFPRLNQPGPIVDIDGNVVGNHDGVIGYTIGQRKGFGIGGTKYRTFVLDVDVENNRLVIGRDEMLFMDWCRLQQVNLIGEIDGSDPRCSNGWFSCRVMLRYNGDLTGARVWCDSSGEALVEFARPARAPTPGQSAVFYRGRRCLGGGIIHSTELTENLRTVSG